MSTTIEVVGLGYIGLPTAVAFATKGFSVIGVDINAATVDAVNAGHVPFVEPDLEVALSGAVAMGRLTASLQIQPADVFIIAVPTPFGARHQPDMSYVEAAVTAMAPHLRPGNLVILESTSPPGTTKALSKRLAELRRDLTLPHVAGDDADIAVVHCPERVLPGRIMVELVTNDRVVGGISPAGARRAAALYRSFCQGECVVTDATTAELVKLAENSYRDVNIAFANELSAIAARLEVDAFEVVALANRHPRVNILRPGPGVGGHCLAVDPWFIVDAAPEESVMIRTAREINDGKPLRVVDEVEHRAKAFAAPVIACLGLAFKANVDDLRQSPAVGVVAELATRGVGRVVAVEPHIAELPPPLHDSKVELVSLSQALSAADIIVVLVAHDVFGPAAPAEVAGKVIVDTCGAWWTRSGENH